MLCLQVMTHEILDVWGAQGLETHVKKMQTEYKERAAIVQRAAGETGVQDMSLCIHSICSSMCKVDY